MSDKEKSLQWNEKLAKMLSMLPDGENIITSAEEKYLSEALAKISEISEAFPTLLEAYENFQQNEDLEWLEKTPVEEKQMMAAAIRQWNADGQQGSLRTYIDLMATKKIMHKSLTNLVFLLDKLSSTLFITPLEEQKEEGKEEQKEESKEESKEKHFGYDVVMGQDENVYVSVDLYLDGTKYTLTCDRPLNIFDKRVYFAVCSEYEAGNAIISVSRIAETMGYTGRPDKKIFIKINDSLTKMRAATIYIDNTLDANASGGKRAKFVRDSSLLNFDRATIEINKIPTKGAIRLYTEPILLSFSKTYGQFTVIPVSATRTPLRLTEATMELEDYLVQRICHIKRRPEKYFPKFMWETIFKNCGVNGKARKTKNETKEKTRVLFNHYTEIGLIEGWSEEEDGVTIKIKGTKKRKSKPTTAKSAK